MRIGIVCPYSFDAPGGVQFHIRDLAEALQARGHFVSVLAPADVDTDVPDVVTSAGKAIPIRYNGSVARLSFGPRMQAAARRWLESNHFDVVHLHEPQIPSLSMLALWEASGPVVATFHTSMLRSRALQVAFPFLRPSLEKIGARIAVSEDARRTLTEHLGGDAIVIPNGVYVDKLGAGQLRPQWQGTGLAPTISFLGRLDEPRKGLPVLTAAIPQVLAVRPGARFLIAGHGEEGRQRALADLGPAAAQVEFLGAISDEDKAALLKSTDLYIAPQTGGESFGIVLVEAMSAGSGVVASDMGAFRRVLDDGRAGVLFRVGDSEHLAATITAALDHPGETEARRVHAASWVRQFDWSHVTSQVEAVYELAVASGTAIPEGPGTGRRLLEGVTTALSRPREDAGPAPEWVI